MKINEIKDLSEDELFCALKEKRQEIFELRTEVKSSSNTEQPHLIRERRKDIARILTVMRQKQPQIERK